MKQPELIKQHAALKRLIRMAGHDPSTKNIEMLSRWGQYLCVLTAGFVENSVRIIYGAYIVRTANAQTAKYATQMIGGIQNPKAPRLVELASAFDKDWGEELEVFLTSDFRGDAINTIMSNRHLIVHGKDSGITISRVSQNLSKIVEVVDFLERQCGLAI